MNTIHFMYKNKAYEVKIPDVPEGNLVTEIPDSGNCFHENIYDEIVINDEDCKMCDELRKLKQLNLDDNELVGHVNFIRCNLSMMKNIGKFIQQHPDVFFKTLKIIRNNFETFGQLVEIGFHKYFCSNLFSFIVSLDWSELSQEYYGDIVKVINVYHDNGEDVNEDIDVKDNFCSVVINKIKSTQLNMYSVLKFQGNSTIDDLRRYMNNGNLTTEQFCSLIVDNSLYDKITEGEAKLVCENMNGVGQFINQYYEHKNGTNEFVEYMLEQKNNEIRNEIDKNKNLKKIIIACYDIFFDVKLDYNDRYEWLSRLTGFSKFEIKKMIGY